MENINNTELEQMKEQMNLLKEKIEKEKIKRIEFEKEKREHPENIYEPK